LITPIIESVQPITTRPTAADAAAISDEQGPPSKRQLQIFGAAVDYLAVDHGERHVGGVLEWIADVEHQVARLTHFDAAEAGCENDW